MLPRKRKKDKDKEGQKEQRRKKRDNQRIASNMVPRSRNKQSELEIFFFLLFPFSF